MSVSSDFEREPDGKEEALWEAFRSGGSEAAREKLFAFHAGFARSVARRHFYERSRGDLDLQDINQLAYTGLLESLDRYDPRQGTPFKSFAVHRISGSIRDGIIRTSEMREQMSWHNRVKRERMHSIREGSSKTDPIDRLSDLVMGLALGFMLEGTGLVVPEENGQSNGHTGGGTAYDSVAWKEMITQLRIELLKLPEREREILQKHYLIGMTFDDLSSLLRVSKGRISQIHGAALALLRKRMADRGHFRIGSIAK
jgi:RNA polymerase sigma factor for flagellar operon FliA